MSEFSMEDQPSRLGSLLLLSFVIGTLPLIGQNLPQGFVDELVVGGMTRPVGMAFLPDARILVLEQQTGRILVVAGGGLAVAGTITNVVATMTEQGALGITVDPLWPNWPYIYVSYTHANPASLRLLRFTASGDLTSSTST